MFGCHSNTICKLKEKHFAHIFLRHHGTWSSYSLCTYAIYCVCIQFIVHICNLLCTYAIYCVHINLLCTYPIYCVRMQFIVYVCNLLCMYAIYCVRTQFYYQKNQPNCLSKGVLLSHLMIFLLTTKSLWTSECADLHKSFLPQTSHKDHVLLQEVMVPQYTSWKVWSFYLAVSCSYPPITLAAWFHLCMLSGVLIMSWPWISLTHLKWAWERICM